MGQLMLYSDFCKGCVHARSRFLCLHRVWYNYLETYRRVSQGLIVPFCLNYKYGSEEERLQEEIEELPLLNAFLLGKEVPKYGNWSKHD